MIYQLIYTSQVIALPRDFPINITMNKDVMKITTPKPTLFINSDSIYSTNKWLKFWDQDNCNNH